MRFAQNFEFRNSDLRRRRLGRRLNPRANQLIVLGYAVKPLESKETKASKEITVTHNSVFAAHRLQCRMTNRKNRHPAFCLCGKIESGKQEAYREAAACNAMLSRRRVSAAKITALLLERRNVAGGNLPPAIPLDQSIRELHHSIEWFAVRFSFHMRFSKNNRCVVAVQAALHLVVFKCVVMD